MDHARQAQPKPLRLLVDLTEMLRANGSLQMPASYRYRLRFDFKAWYVNNKTDSSLFVYKPIEDAEEFDSIEAYYESLEQPSEPAAANSEPAEEKK